MTQGEDAAGASGTLELPPVAFNAGLAGTLFYFLDDRPPTNVELDTFAALSVLPERPAGFDVSVAFARMTRPFTAYAGSGENNFYAEDRVTPRANLRAQSRSGVLRGALAYAPLIDIFENQAFDYLSSLTHEVSASAAWKFLPFTAMVYDGSVYFTRYFDLRDQRAIVKLSDSNRFQSRIGVNGAITPRLSARALAGYSFGNYDDPVLSDFENVIGEAALTYRMDTFTVEAGYVRAVLPSSVGGWMREDRGFLTASTLLGRVVALTLRGGAGRAHYGRMLDANGVALGIDAESEQVTEKREDTRIDGGFHAEYRITNWLAVMADLSALVTLTDFRFRTETPFPYPAEFYDYQAFGGIRVHY